MKKIGLSIVVIAAFLFYSWQQHTKGANAPVVALPNQTKNSNTTIIPTSSIANGSTYKDGAYTGKTEDAFYGNIQVQITIAGSKISEIQFLQYPHDQETSIQVSDQSMPILKSEAISAQSAHVDVVSGATDTSAAFTKSMQSALDQAKV